MRSEGKLRVNLDLHNDLLKLIFFATKTKMYDKKYELMRFSGEYRIMF